MNIKGYTLPQGAVLHGKSYSYRIEQVLGQGSFGITYLASVRMEGALGSIDAQVKVAVKEFFMKEINGREGTTVTSGSKGGLFADYRKKFVREATNLSRLRHPHIIQVLECFEANNTVYYAMEYLDGGSLDDLIARRHGLPETEALGYVRQVADALTYMHAHNVLHLDLKPGNIMLHQGKAVLIDFGLSKQYDEDGNPDSSTTVGGGTPGYAPIEQANYRDGKGFPVTMDIYALGGTLYKMLTGQRPPEASEVLNEGLPPKPAQVSATTWAAVEAAMQSLRKNRPQTVEAWMAMLLSTQCEGDVDETTSYSTNPIGDRSDEKSNENQGERDGISYVAFHERKGCVDVNVFYKGQSYVMDYGPLESVTNDTQVNHALEVVPHCCDVIPVTRRLNEYIHSIGRLFRIDYMVIAYNSLSDYLQIQRILTQYPSYKVKVVREMELWAVCENARQDKMVEFRRGDAFCLCEYGGGVIDILETGFGRIRSEIPPETNHVKIETEKDSFARLVVGAWIQYSIFRQCYKEDKVCLYAFPFKIEAFVFQHGRVRDVIPFFKRLPDTLPCKRSIIVDYGKECDIELLIDNYPIKVDLINLFGYVPTSFEIITDIGDRLVFTFRDSTSGKECKLELS